LAERAGFVASRISNGCGNVSAWARLMHRRSDHLIEDARIAATALGHGLIVATRNAKDFVDFDAFAYQGP